MPEFPDDLQVRFEEAIKLFQERIPVSDEVLDELEERYRQQAFFVTGVSKAEMLEDIIDYHRERLDASEIRAN